MKIKVHLWVQRPPRIQWCLKVTVEDETGTAIARTWLDEYSPQSVPPTSVTGPLSVMLMEVAVSGLKCEDSVGRRYQLDVRKAPGAPDPLEVMSRVMEGPRLSFPDPRSASVPREPFKPPILG